MTTLRLAEHNLHEVRVDGRRVLFHIPTSALFELDDLGGAVLDAFREQESWQPDAMAQRLAPQFASADVSHLLAELEDLHVIQSRAPRAEQARNTSHASALSTLVLNVNTGCNLSCTYCYKEDLATPANGQLMGLDTARASVDLLLAESGARKRVNLVFFGGEPLTNMALIREVVAYADEKAGAEGKLVDYSMTTNATLLNEKLVDWFNEHRFGLTISMDGPQALHDLNRRTVGGHGTYDVVAAKARMLLDRYSSRPVGARVTLTPGVTDIVAIHGHLFDELGFHEVGFAPVTAADNAVFNLNEAELGAVFEGMKELGRRYEVAAIEGRNNGFSNLHQLITDMLEGTRKLIPCGAGVGLLAVDKDGDLNLCHRFTGSDLPTFGNVNDGIDHAAVDSFVDAALDRTDKACSTCRIRNLCSGGCYHESYARYGDPLHPTYHYCDLMRDWVDFGITVYTRIRDANPDFFKRHIEPRRAKP